MKRTEIGQIGEFGLIDKLANNIHVRHSNVKQGIGDDAAVIETGCDNKCILTSTEIYTEGIHFELIYHPLKHLGYKLAVATISDIYAMNAHAQQLMVSMALSNRFSVEAVEELYAGIKKACEVYNVDIVGGDTASSRSGLAISMTAIGITDAESIVYRNGAKVGDMLCVSGDLGASYLGLQILEREKQLYLDNPEIQPELDDQAYLIGRQLKPEARVDMLEYFIRSKFRPTSMIDISDGLASDLMQLCRASKTGALVEEANVPIHNEAKLKAINFQLDPITCALNGGEDYELLFTASPGDIEKVKYLPDTYIIGEMTDPADGVKLVTTGGNLRALKAPGWRETY